MHQHPSLFKEISSQTLGVFHYQSHIKEAAKIKANAQSCFILEERVISCDIMPWISANIELQLESLQPLKEERSSGTESYSGRQE